MKHFHFILSLGLIISALFFFPVKASAYTQAELDDCPELVALIVQSSHATYYNSYSSDDIYFTYSTYQGQADLALSYAVTIYYIPDFGNSVGLQFYRGSYTSGYLSQRVSSDSTFRNLSFYFVYPFASNQYPAGYSNEMGYQGNTVSTYRTYYNGWDNINPIVIYGDIPSEFIEWFGTGFDTEYYLVGGERFSTTESDSDLGLVSSLYDIYFNVTSASNDSVTAQSLLNTRHKCALNYVYSDNGYTMLSIQCMPLAVSADTVFYGYYEIIPRKTGYSISDFKISFCTDVPSDSELIIPDDDFFKVNVLVNPPDVGSVLDNPATFTVNSLRFFNSSNQICRYNNREFIAFDYSDNSNSYPLFQFFGCANSNMYSAGSFIYNFQYSSILDNGTALGDDDIDKMKEDGQKENGDIRDETAYVPTYVTYPDTSTDFTVPDFTDYDFSPLTIIFNALFNSYVITLCVASATIGFIGYVLFGRGD